LYLGVIGKETTLHEDLLGRALSQQNSMNARAALGCGAPRGCHRLRVTHAFSAPELEIEPQLLLARHLDARKPAVIAWDDVGTSRLPR